VTVGASGDLSSSTMLDDLTTVGASGNLTTNSPDQPLTTARPR
jgi:hypothetical protein